MRIIIIHYYVNSTIEINLQKRIDKAVIHKRTILIKGDTGIENVTLERRPKSLVLLGPLRSDHTRRLGLRDATLDGGYGERRARVRASRAKNDPMVT